MNCKGTFGTTTTRMTFFSPGMAFFQRFILNLQNVGLPFLPQRTAAITIIKSSTAVSTSIAFSKIKKARTIHFIEQYVQSFAIG